MSLVIVGTVAFDSIYTTRGKAEHVIGGAATYASWAASYFTNNVNMVSIVGNDFPTSELEELRVRGVNTDGIEHVEDKKSFFWAGKYDSDMNSRETLVTELNVLENFNPTLPDSYRSAEYVLLGNLTPDVQMHVLNQIDDPKFVALDTMNFWMDVAKPQLLKVIEKIDVLVINDEEARQLSGVYSLAMAAKVILAMGPKYLVIKKGEHGALLFADDTVFFAPALPLTEVNDPTGAGDTFAGGFMGYMAMTGETNIANMKRAVIYGSVMASFCVEDFSIDRLKGLSENDISSRLKKFVDIVHFSPV